MWYEVVEVKTGFQVVCHTQAGVGMIVTSRVVSEFSGRTIAQQSADLLNEICNSSAK